MGETGFLGLEVFLTYDIDCLVIKNRDLLLRKNLKNTWYH
jgi:hypothetical protein